MIRPIATQNVPEAPYNTEFVYGISSTSKEVVTLDDGILLENLGYIFPDMRHSSISNFYNSN